MANELDNEPMPARATANLFIWASGFGIGALLILTAFVFLIGVGEVAQHGATPASPAAQSAANAPVAPGPAPKPAPDTAAPVPETTGQAAPANSSTPQAPTQSQQQKP